MTTTYDIGESLARYAMLLDAAMKLGIIEPEDSYEEVKAALHALEGAS